VAVVIAVLAALSGEVGAQAPDATTTTTTAPPTTTPDPAPAPAPTLADPEPLPFTPLPPATPGPPPLVDPSPPPQLRRPAEATGRAAEAARRRAKLELAAAEKELKAAQGHEAQVAKRLRSFETAVAEAEGRLAALGEEEQSTAERLVSARGRLRDLAVGQYVTGGYMGLSLHYLVNAEGPEDLARRGALLGQASEVQRSATNTYKRANQAVSDQIRTDVRIRDEAISNRDLTAAELLAASEQVRIVTAEVENRRLLLDVATAAAPVLPSDIPRLFLDAYQRAASTMQREQPRCRVGWTAIAAIGKIESDHGRFRGSQSTLNGDPVTPIIGIRLDGSNSAVITDTDGGLVDGDLEFDRAVGPMQFIPSTWKRWAADGDGDGAYDPQDVDDATLAAGRYLCESGPLTTAAGWRAAVLSYNASDAYLRSVLAATNDYAERSRRG
jgi:membrane-bound lytic murein transglycosylase B